MSIPKYIQIDGHDNLVRDTKSMGIINTNTHALSLAKMRRKEAMLKVAEDLKQKQDINSLRAEVGELTRLVATLLERDK